MTYHDAIIIVGILFAASVLCYLALCIGGGGMSPPPGYGYDRPWWKVLLGIW